MNNLISFVAIRRGKLTSVAEVPKSVQTCYYEYPDHSLSATLFYLT